MLEDNELLEATSRLTPQWLAGFFDGKGCVCTKNTSGGAGTLRVNLTQTDAKLLALVAMAFPGEARGPYAKYHPRSTSVCYEINWTGKSARTFLERIKDHVIAKRHQVELALEMLNTVYCGSGNSLTQVQTNRRKEICDEMSRLNGNRERNPKYQSKVSEFSGGAL
jgi:hypothetical protein